MFFLTNYFSLHIPDRNIECEYLKGFYFSLISCLCAYKKLYVCAQMCVCVCVRLCLRTQPVHMLIGFRFLFLLILFCWHWFVYLSSCVLFSLHLFVLQCLLFHLLNYAFVTSILLGFASLFHSGKNSSDENLTMSLSHTTDIPSQ